MLTVALPFFLVWAFFAELLIEIVAAFRWAWLEARSTFDEYLRQIRRDDY